MSAETIHSSTLPNGLRLVCAVKPGAPVVAVQVWYQAGSALESAGERGLAHFLEHMMFRGSALYGPERHARSIADVGGHCNAFTTEDCAVYTNAVPCQHLEMVLALESDRMCNLTLDPKLFDIERRVVTQEYHMQMSNPAAKAFVEFRKSFFGDHPYALSPIGLIEDIEHAGVDRCRALYQRCYRPSNALIVIAGDIGSVERAQDLVLRHFVSLSNETAALPDVAQRDRPDGGGRTFERRVEFDVPMVVRGYATPCAGERDALAVEVVTMLLAQGESSRLHQGLVRGSQVAVMAGGTTMSLKKAGMTLLFAAFTPTIASAAVCDALRAEVAQLRDTGPSEAELEKLRNTTLTQRCFELYTAEHLCHRLGYAQEIEGDWHSWTGRLEQLRSITRETVIDAARRYFADDSEWTLTLRPRHVNPALLVAGLLRGLSRPRRAPEKSD